MNPPEVYQTGNPWQKKVYQQLADYLAAIPEIKSYGVSKNGNSYLHLLRKEDAEHNFLTPEIHEATRQRFKTKAGDLHRVLTNTAASQNYCVNLVIYLDQHRHLADALFSKLLGKEVKVLQLIPEFTPKKNLILPYTSEPVDETIGDQNGPAGTDADIGVFYTYEDDKNGVLMIEFKFIEAEFSVCGSYHRGKEKKANREDCNQSNFFEKSVLQNDPIKNTPPFCGYARYYNWPLTEKSAVFDFGKIRKLEGCPFRDGLNQLWRNMLLSEQVAMVRKLDEFSFWVLSPQPNDEFLWKNGNTEKVFRSILTKQGNRAFRKVHLEAIHELLGGIITDENDQKWLAKLNRKYLI
jgi:hypothetical protein